MMTGRGWKKISPDDMRGMPIPGDRMRGRAWRQGTYAKRRHWGSGRREEREPQEDGSARFQLVPGVKRPRLSEQSVTPAAMKRGLLAGYLAAGLLGLWLVVLLLSLVSGLLFGGGLWQEWLWPAFGVALVGTQTLGFVSDALTASRSVWGMRALVGFWISLLVWVPLGFLISLMTTLLG